MGTILSTRSRPCIGSSGNVITNVTRNCTVCDALTGREVLISWHGWTPLCDECRMHVVDDQFTPDDHWMIDDELFFNELANMGV